MGSVGKAISNAVTNPIKQVVSSTEKVFTNPGKANLGDFASALNPLGGTIVSDVKHPQDAATQAGVAGAVLGAPYIGGALYSAGGALIRPLETIGGQALSGLEAGIGGIRNLASGYSPSALFAAGQQLPGQIGGALSTGFSDIGSLVSSIARAVRGPTGQNPTNTGASATDNTANTTAFTESLAKFGRQFTSGFTSIAAALSQGQNANAANIGNLADAIKGAAVNAPGPSSGQQQAPPQTVITAGGGGLDMTTLLLIGAALAVGFFVFKAKK